MSAPRCDRCGYLSPDTKVMFCGMCGLPLDDDAARLAAALSNLEPVEIKAADIDSMLLEIAMDAKDDFERATDVGLRNKINSTRTRAVMGIAQARSMEIASMEKAAKGKGDKSAYDRMGELMRSGSRPASECIDVTPELDKLPSPDRFPARGNRHADGEGVEGVETDS